MANLILNSLEIRNFRASHHLKIEHLCRVNLIVGKNNIGKKRLGSQEALPFALFDGIVEFDERPLLSEGEQVMRSEDACEHMRRSSSLEKKHLRQRARGAG